MNDNELKKVQRTWNAAIEAAVSVCLAVDRASHGQGHQMGPARAAGSKNPYAHLSGEIGLGAMRCANEIRKLHRG